MKPKLYLINGPLGAGKTTVLRNLLAQDVFRHARVIENEFANYSVDSAAFHDSAHEIETLAGTCICCSDGDELVTILHRFAQTTEPVLIEATGVANSLKLLEKLILGGVFEQYQLAHGLYVLDGVEAVAQGAEEYIGELQAADTVLVSKSDLLSEQEASRLRETLLSYGVTTVEESRDGVFDSKRLDVSSQMIEFYGSFDGEMRLHDSAMNYAVIDVSGVAISPGTMKQNWQHLSKKYGLRRLKGSFLDESGGHWHIEATPAQLKCTPAQVIEPQKLVVIGSQTRNCKKATFQELLR